MMPPETIARIEQALAKPGPASSDFDLNPDVALPPNRTLREAAVLVPLSVAAGQLHLILTKRASHLKHHPGQIAFPGGKRDAGDADLFQTALREADEEIALPRTLPRILGTLAPHETVTGFVVTPVVAFLDRGFNARPDTSEVAEVFSVPLSHVLEPGNFVIEGRRWRGQTRHYYTVPFGPYYIWGATARILRAFAAKLS